MDRDTFSHIRLWCPRPFGTYSQNKVRSTGSGGSGGGVGLPTLCKAEPPPARRYGDGAVRMAGPEESGGEEGAGTENTPPHPELSSSSLTPSQAPPHSSSSTTAPSSVPTSGAQMEDGRVLLDTWYVIKPGNTKEKIAFFVGHQFSGTGLCRPSAMKVKGNWATDCSKAKRRRRCSSYDPPTRSQISSSRPDPPLTAEVPPGPDEPPPEGKSETDLLSVAEMVALVEQRTAMALQGMAAAQGSQQAGHSQGMSTHQHTLLRSTLSDPTPTGYLSDGSEAQPAGEPQGSPSPIQTDQELELDEEEEEEEQEESCRVAEAIARFESQSAESGLRLGSGHAAPSAGKEPAPPPPPGPRHGEVRIAFRVSSLEPRCQSEPAGRPRCMFMSCGGGAGQSGQPGPKEKITCDLYQLVSPSSLDPSSLLLAKADADHHHHPDRQAGGGPDPGHEPSAGEQRERMTGFHVEVVVTGAVDQCVFYGKDGTENAQEETVCFAMPAAADASSDDPPPGQLFFLQPPPRGLEDDQKGPGSSSDCAVNNNNKKKGAAGERAGDSPPGSAGTAEAPEDCADPSLCRLYRHVSHDFLEIRFQIQRLLEPRQYMLLLPDHIMVSIFSHLPTRSLAALKCTCHDFRALIEAYGVRPVDSRWNQDPLYRDDPCKQCKRQYERGDVSLCRWHPKPYHHDLPYGRSYWMCCRRTDKDTPGCRVGLHDNNWVQALDGLQPAARAKREDRREEAR